ncbi:hypothetical protein ACFYWU_17055 [Streptomyces chrestomyceticus]|uniref:hypothetical protein n=1 Tax=Streptomyces chrestomyceticus TaxID=68185 RepID=UPI0036A4D656
MTEPPPVPVALPLPRCVFLAHTGLLGAAAGTVLAGGAAPAGSAQGTPHGDSDLVALLAIHLPQPLRASMSGLLKYLGSGLLAVASFRSVASPSRPCGTPADATSRRCPSAGN